MSNIKKDSEGITADELHSAISDGLKSIVQLSDLDDKDIERKNTYEDAYKVQKTHLLLNAQFLYAYSCFERILVKFTKYHILNSKSIKSNYIRQFTSLVEKKYEETSGKAKKNWQLYFNNEAKMFSDYHVFFEHKQNIIDTLKNVLEVNFKDEAISETYKQFIEIRERRNLLTHRSKKPDNKYYDILNKNGIDKKYLKKEVFSKGKIWNVTTPPKYVESKKAWMGKINPIENPVDLSISHSYLFSSQNVFVELICYIQISIAEKNISKDETALPPIFDVVHDASKYCIEIKFNVTLLTIWLKFIQLGKKLDLKKFTKLHPIDCVNFIIISDYLLKCSATKRLPVKKQFLESLISKLKSDEIPEVDNVKVLLGYLINNRKTDFVNYTRELISQDSSKWNYNIHQWMLFHKYRKFL